jgi:hypothetical protein
MMIGPSARRRSRPGAQRPDRSDPLPAGPRSVPSAWRSSSGLDRSRPILARLAPGPPRNVAPCPATAVAIPPPACKASLGRSFLARSSPPVQGRGMGVEPGLWRPGGGWGVFEAAGKEPSRNALWPVPIGPLLVHQTRASGECKPAKWRVEHRPCRRGRRSRWGAQPHTGKHSRVVSHLHQHKDVAKPEPCHLGSGFCGDSVGTDVSALKRDSVRHARPVRASRPPLIVQRRQAGAGIPPLRRAEPLS